MVVPVDESDESRFRLLEPIRQLAAEQLAARGETETAREAHTQWYLELLVLLDEQWRAGDDQGSWPVAAQELPNLQVAFDHLVDAGRIDDAQRFAVAGFGPVNNHFDNAPTFDWAPRAASLDLDHVGPFTASVCAVAAWGPLAQDDLEGAADMGSPRRRGHRTGIAGRWSRRCDGTEPCVLRRPARGQRGVPATKRGRGDA